MVERFPFLFFLHTLYITSSHVFRRSWWHIFESFPFGGDFSFESVHGCAGVCAKIYYLSRAVSKVCSHRFIPSCPSTPSQCPTQTPLRGAPKAECHNLREAYNSCFCAANSFFRPPGSMVRGYDTSLQFAWSLTTLLYSPLPLHQSDKALVGQAPFFGRFNLPLIPTRSFQNYTDYFKCISAKGEDFAPCKQFRRAYHSLCPSTSCLKFLSLNFCVNISTTR